MTTTVGSTGVWSIGMHYGNAESAADAAAALEELGYSAIWLPDAGGDVFRAVERLLAATNRLTVATGILNLWIHEASEVATRSAELVAAHGPRLLIGIGVSHRPSVDRLRQGAVYAHPLAATAGFLDELDAAQPTLAVGSRALAALGPKMLDLAAHRTAGVLSFLAPPEHTGPARAAVGSEALVAAEQAVVLETAPTRAREIARTRLAPFLVLPNYVSNWRRLGFGDDDFAGGGSDRLIDALVAWGDEETIAERVQSHRDAGADHVCVHVLSEGVSIPLDTWRTLAPALIGDATGG